MHFNEGSGMIDNAGTPEFIDKNLPGTPGATILAEFMNAVTFEIENVVKAAGLTFSPDAVTDRANGWAQLKQAIFESATLNTAALADGAITDPKVTSINLSKLYGTLTLTGSPGGSVILQMALDEGRVKLNVDYGDGRTAETVTTSLGVDVTSNTTPGVSLTVDGLRNIGVANSPPLKMTVIDLSNNADWTFLAGPSDLSSYNGIATGVPKTKKIHNMVFSIEDLSKDGTGDYDGPVISFNNGSTTVVDGKDKYLCEASSRSTSTDWHITVIVEALLNTVNYATRKLYIVHE